MTGTFVNNVKQGRCVVKYNNGETYNGDFKDDVQHGMMLMTTMMTTMMTTTTMMMMMSMKNILLYISSGNGTYSFSDGSHYTGQWQYGVKHGRGKYRFAS